MSDTAHTRTTDAVTLWINGRDARDGTATLTQVVDAYRDRAHLIDGGGLVYFLPNAPSRVRTVRALLRWWFEVARRAREGADPRRLDPCQESPAFRRRLLT